MGTIEQLEETERAGEEIARVLKPGGRAIVGVPNRHDPFLRPLFAAALQAVGLYGYGYEKSYSRRALRLVRPFVFLDRHVPAVRRHGYLLATVVVKPVQQDGRREAGLPAG